MRLALGAVAVAAALLAAGCSSSAGTKADVPVISAPVQSTEATVMAIPSSAAGTTPAQVPSSPASPSNLTPSVTAPPAQSSSVTAPPIVPRSTCTKLTIRAIPGGASMGQEIAALQFTNEGSTPCDLYGYAAVTLMLNGRPLGRPSQPASTATSHRMLAPGATAESLLHNYVTNCQAPLSDNVRVVAPGSSQTLVRPMQLRACLLRVDPLGAPD